MRAPARSFKSEITAYRQWLDTFGDAERRLAVKVLDSWERHLDAERIWSTIEKNLQAEVMPSARDFITFVLERAWTAVQLGIRISQFPIVESEVDDRIEHHRKNKRYELLVDEMSRLDQFKDDAERMLGRKKRMPPANSSCSVGVRSSRSCAENRSMTLCAG
jgi:hypothetical protein